MERTIINFERLIERLQTFGYRYKFDNSSLLKTGTNKTAKKETADSLFKGHIANIIRLASLGKLIVAGPIKKNDKSYRGIFILNVSTIEEANALLTSDPAIKEKLLEAELFQWYGSAALPEYLKVHEKIEKKKR